MTNRQSTPNLTARVRSVSHASIRKRLLHSSSQDRNQMMKTTTASTANTGFKPKLQRLLNENKIDVLMSLDPQSKAALYYTTHVNGMQKQLSNAKKSLSSMVMRTRQKQFNINRFKNQLVKLERDIDIVLSQSNSTRCKYEDVSQQLQAKAQALQDKVWEQKSFKQIKQRVQRSQEYQKALHDRKDEQAKTLCHHLKQLERTYHELYQLNGKLHKNLQTARGISREQALQKNEYIELMHLEMVEKEMLDELKVEKMNREDEIRVIMPSMIEQEELNKYLNILFTHKVLGQIIKRKSERAMEKYKDVQNAYMRIKSETNIAEMGKILNRMESQDLEYEGLLRTVEQLEAALEAMGHQMKLAAEKESEILSRGGQPLEINYQGIEKERYEAISRQKDKLIEKKLEDDILKKQIMSWVAEYASLFNLDSKFQNQEDFFQQLKVLQVGMKKRVEKSAQ